MSLINTGSFSKALWPGVNKWYGKEYNDYATEYDQIFDQIDRYKYEAVDHPGEESPPECSISGLNTIYFRRHLIILREEIYAKKSPCAYARALMSTIAALFSYT